MNSHTSQKALSQDSVWRFSAPCRDSLVPQVRHAVRDLLDSKGVPLHGDIAQGLLLIVSELVTNAVRHAAVLSDVVSVELSISVEWVRFSVEDAHPYRPKALEVGQEDTGGRGLLLVKKIAGESGGVCGVDRTPSGGKIVWAALPLLLVR